jgi:hypothetical protein
VPPLRPLAWSPTLRAPFHRSLSLLDALASWQNKPSILDHLRRVARQLYALHLRSSLCGPGGTVSPFGHHTTPLSSLSRPARTAVAIFNRWIPDVRTAILSAFFASLLFCAASAPLATFAADRAAMAATELPTAAAESQTNGDVAGASDAGSDHSAEESTTGIDGVALTTMDDTVMENVDAAMGGDDAFMTTEDSDMDPEEAVKTLLNASFLQLMEFDTRPTFVVDVDEAQCGTALLPVYRNKALENDDILNSCVNGTYHEENSNISWAYTYQCFKNFVSYNSQADSSSDQYMFRGFFWTRYIAFDRWIVMSGTPLFHHSVKRKDSAPARSVAGSSTAKSDQTLPPSRRKRFREDNQRQSRRLKPRDNSEKGTVQRIYCDTPLKREGENAPPATVFDWTLRELDEYASQHLRYARETDWASTPLGPVSTWPPVLRTFSNLVMLNPDPAVMFWGDSTIMIYNERYRELIGPELHAKAMGTNVFVRPSWFSP